MFDTSFNPDTPAGKGTGGAPSLREEPRPTEWRDVHIWSMEAHDHNHVIEALLAHLNCSLQRRWNPDKGVEWRFEPKP